MTITQHFEASVWLNVLRLHLNIWHFIHFIVHCFWPYPYGPWSKTVHYKGKWVPFGMYPLWEMGNPWGSDQCTVEQTWVQVGFVFFQICWAFDWACPKCWMSSFCIFGTIPLQKSITQILFESRSGITRYFSLWIVFSMIWHTACSIK